MGNESEYDVVIIGGGPAGLSAALCLGRARRSVLVIDSGHPRHAVAEGVHNFLTREGIPPAELRIVAWEQMSTYPTVSRMSGAATSLEQRGSRWVVTTDDGRSVSAEVVLLATGVVDQPPEIPGYADLWGHAIFHCPYCHGWEARDGALAVLGQGPDIGHYAALVQGWSDDVVVFTNGEAAAPEVDHELGSRGIDIHTAPITALEKNGGGLVIVLEDGTRIARDAMFVMSPTRLPDLVANLGLELTDAGFVRIDEHGATTRPGIWAAGDLTSRRHQVVEAMAQGLRSGVAINRQFALRVPAR